MSNSRQTRLFSEADLPPQPLAWELAAEADQLLAEVVFNRPLTTAYHYLVPNELRENIGPGQRVQVPFGRGNKSVNGYCVGLSNHIPTGKLLKSITAVLDRTALIDTRMLELTHWIADRYLCGWGQVLESVIPAGVKTQAGSREVLLFFLGPQLIEQLQRINPDPAGHGGGKRHSRGRECAAQGIETSRQAACRHRVLDGSECSDACRSIDRSRSMRDRAHSRTAR